MALKFFMVALALAVSNVNSACLPCGAFLPPYAPALPPCPPALPPCVPALPPCAPALPPCAPALPPCAPALPLAPAPGVMYVMTLPAPALAPALAPAPLLAPACIKKYPKFESETSHILPLEVPSSIPVGQFCSVQKVALQPAIKPVPADFAVESPPCAAPLPAPCAAPLPAPCAASLPVPCAPACL